MKGVTDDEQASFSEEGDAVFTPALKLWAFPVAGVAQSRERSCVAAVARVITLLVASGGWQPAGQSRGACRDAGRRPSRAGRPAAASQ